MWSKGPREARLLEASPQPGSASPGTPSMPKAVGSPAGLSWNLQKGRFKEERKRRGVVGQITRPQSEETPGWFSLRGALAARLLRVPVTCVSSLRAVSSLQRWPQLSQSYFAADLREARQLAQLHQRISLRDGTLMGVSGWQVGASKWAPLCTAAQMLLFLPPRRRPASTPPASRLRAAHCLGSQPQALLRKGGGGRGGILPSSSL